MSNKYHVGCGISNIYAGILNKSGDKWVEKTECTDEAINTVRDYMTFDLLGSLENPQQKTGAYIWKLKNGQTVELRISIKDEVKINE
ncbi:MAG: hypothetical protein IJA34_00805 [Lachnospiraceae bacterium]|nr:hypothetical protein [Lachnospiraceae bacterium]